MTRTNPAVSTWKRTVLVNEVGDCPKIVRSIRILRLDFEQIRQLETYLFHCARKS